MKRSVTKKERGKRNVRPGRRSGRKPRSGWRLICLRGVVAEKLNPEGNWTAWKGLGGVVAEKLDLDGKWDGVVAEKLDLDGKWNA